VCVGGARLAALAYFYCILVVGPKGRSPTKKSINRVAPTLELLKDSFLEIAPPLKQLLEHVKRLVTSMTKVQNRYPPTLIPS
jgi:hypothetical protein